MNDRCICEHAFIIISYHDRTESFTRVLILNHVPVDIFRTRVCNRCKNIPFHLRTCKFSVRLMTFREFRSCAVFDPPKGGYKGRVYGGEEKRKKKTHRLDEIRKTETVSGS